MLTKKELEIILSKLKPYGQKPSLEQYTITSSLAAEILHIARMNGDIVNKKVADFGCGSGRLAIGAALLDAKSVTAVDIDKACILAAKENLRIAEQLSGRKIKSIKFVCSDIKYFNGRFDTVVQNPPFGIQSLHADRIFLKKAIACANRIYSLHKNGYEKTVRFLKKFIENNGCRVLAVQKFKFDLPYTFKFHQKPKYSYSVALYVIEAAK